MFTNQRSANAWQHDATRPVASASLAGETPQSTQGLFTQLDSRDFSQRERATAAIIKLGGVALPDLAKHFFGASPETNYRIRIALEGIAKTGDEDLFLRTTAILLTLYANGNSDIFEQIKVIQVNWQKQRTEFAIENLKKSGAEVTVQTGYNSGAGAVRVEFINGGRISSVSRQDISAIKKIKSVKRTLQQQRQLVQEILKNDASSNREFILELMPDNSGLEQALSARVSSLTIKFPEDWAVKNPGPEKIEPLNQISGQLLVNVTNMNLSDAQWKSLAENQKIVALTLNLEQTQGKMPGSLPPAIRTLTVLAAKLDGDFVDGLERCSRLQQLHLKNCRFSATSAQRIDAISSIKSYSCEFTNFNLDRDLVLGLSELKNLRTLHLDRVKFDQGALDSLSRLENLSSLYVSNTPATAAFFDGVSAVTKLRRIQFTGCKIDIAAYKTVEANQRIRMTFEARAFLGIQGNGVLNVDRPGVDTMVSLVVPDSGAEEGGVKVGDFISKIDGHKVEDFNDVRLLIAQFTPGDEISLEVLRAGKPIPLSIKLRDYATARKF